MQERAGEAFVICTANDVSQLPPELLRKGRFDELWFIDLPNASERVEVLKTALREHKRDKVKVDHARVAGECKQFTGAEIAALVPDALYTAFGDNKREITTADLIAAAKNVVPLAETAKAKVDALRAWGKNNARQASLPEQEATTRARARVLDIG